MKVVIKETGKQEVLELLDRDGTDCIVDVIGNYDGLGNAEYQFSFDSEYGVYYCNKSTYDWWAKVAADQQELNDRIAALSDEYGYDIVQEAIGSAGDCDLEDQAAAINAALDEEFGAVEGK